MPALTTQLDEHPTGPDLDRIVQGVRAFNRTVGGQEPPRPVACFLRDPSGRILGGAAGQLWGRSLHVTALWVEESLRGEGRGAALLRELEACALRRGYPLAYVETLSFQAKPFYESQGYQVFGRLDEIAPGCTFYFLRKDLSSAAPLP